MSTFWSVFVTLLTLGTLLAMVWLLFSTRKGQPGKPGEKTLGQAFDGIEEYDNPLPRWWFVLFVATLVFALGYLALYPGLGNFSGWLPGYRYLDSDTQTPFSDGQRGWTAVHEWERETRDAQVRYGPIFARFAAMPVEDVARDPQALKIGARLFAANCALCHGADGGGAFGYPDLTDSNWRWGGDAQSIKASIMNGRMGMMPPWGAALGEQGVSDVSAYVVGRLLAREVPANGQGSAARGEPLYATMCAGCHGPQGKGNPLVGAPDLTQAQAFMYGSRLEQIEESVRAGRQGQMPAQQVLQGDDRVHVLAAYVYSLSQPDDVAPDAQAEP